MSQRPLGDLAREVRALACIEHVLVPTLNRGDIVIMDNVGSHKRPEARRAIGTAGVKFLFLPAYSPDLNPSEQMFAKLKTLLSTRMGQLLRNSGYAST